MINDQFIKKLKYSRLSAEERCLYEIFDNIIVKRNGSDVSFIKNDMIIFQLSKFERNNAYIIYIHQPSIKNNYCNINNIFTNLLYNYININYDIDIDTFYLLYHQSSFNHPE
jgi:hypothetical protein